MKFATKIKMIRTNNNLTQEEFASKLFVSRSAVAKWEQDRGLPSLDVLHKISETFNISLDDLFEEEDTKINTIKNTNNINKLQKYKYILLVDLFILSIVLITFILIYVKNTFTKEEKTDLSIEYSLYVKVIGETVDYYKAITSKSDKMIIFDKNYKDGNGNEEEYHIEHYNANSEIYIDKKDRDKFNCYDIVGNKVSLDNIQEGYLLEVTYKGCKKTKYNYYPFEDVEKKSEDIVKVTIIDDYIEKYQCYGFFVSTNQISFLENPIYDQNLKFSDYESKLYYDYDKYTYTTEKGKTFSQDLIFPQVCCFASGLSMSTPVIPCTDSHYPYDERLGESIPTYCIKTHKVTVSDKLESVSVYAMDNTEKGYSLVGTIEKGNRDNVITVVGYDSYQKKILDGDNADSYDFPLTSKIIWNIQIDFVDSSKDIFIYEYDKDGHLIDEHKYSTYEEIEGELITNFSLTRAEYKANKETLYLIVKEVCNNEEKTYFIGKGDKVRTAFQTKYGYVFSIDIEIHE